MSERGFVIFDGTASGIDSDSEPYKFPRNGYIFLSAFFDESEFGYFLKNNFILSYNRHFIQETSGTFIAGSRSV